MNKIYVAYLNLKGDSNTIQLIAKSNYSSPSFLHKTCEDYVNNRNSPFRIPNPFLTDIENNIKSLLDGLYLYRVDDKRIEMYEKKTIEYTGYIFNSYGLEFNKVGLFQLVDECNHVFDAKHDMIDIPSIHVKSPPTPPPLPSSKNSDPLHQDLLDELKTKHFLKKNITTPFSSSLKKEESGLLDIATNYDSESSYTASTVGVNFNPPMDTDAISSSSSSSIPYEDHYSFREEMFSDDISFSSSSSSSYDDHDYEHERYMNEAFY